MSCRRVAIAVVIFQTLLAASAEPQTPPFRRATRFGPSYRQPSYRESPFHRERRVLNSPSLYAGPYPGGGLYAWRQWYFDRLRHPMFDHTRHPVFRVLPYNRELSMSKSWRDIETEQLDPVTKLQRDVFSDDAHSAEDLLQLKLGY